VVACCSLGCGDKTIIERVGASDASSDSAIKDGSTPLVDGSPDGRVDAAPNDAGEMIDAVSDSPPDGPPDPIVASLEMGQIAVWSLDGDGMDRSGNHLDLTINGPQFGQGNFGQGLVFANDLTKTAMRPMVDASLQLTTGDFTVSFWIELPTSATGPMGFLDMGFAGGGGGWATGTPGPGTTWGFWAPGGTGVFTSGNGSTPNGTFHHVVCIRSGTNLIEYVDQVTPATAAAGTGASPTQKAFRLGTWASIDPLSGTLDDIAIWSRALSQQERAYLDTHPVPPAAP
jgi:hypothetical protein